MTMDWNNRNDWFNPNGQNGKESFEEHNESMSRFRKSHTYVLEHNGRMAMFRKSHPVLEAVASKRPRLDVLKITRPLHVADISGEMGGLRHHLAAEEWHALTPIRKVTLSGGSQN